LNVPVVFTLRASKVAVGSK